MKILFCVLQYQFCDFYSQTNNLLSDLLNTVIGAAIGSGVVVWALYRNFREDKQRDETKRIQFQKEKIKYLQSLVRSILSDLKVQIDWDKEFVEKIREKPIDLPLLRQVPLNELERIVHQLNQEDYYHSYLGEFGNTQVIIDEFRNIISKLNYFDKNISTNSDSLKKSFEFDFERKIKLKNLVEKSMDYIAELLINNEIFEEQDDFRNFLNQTLLDFHEKKTEDSDLKFYHENFVEVLKIGLFKFVKQIPQSNYLITQMKKATFIYSDIQRQNLNVADNFETVHDQMINSFQKFEPLTNRLIEYNGE